MEVYTKSYFAQKDNVMVVKKKGLYLGLLLSLLGIGNLTAQEKEYRFKLVNKTRHEVGVGVSFHRSCRRFFERVRPEKTKESKSSSNCQIKKFGVVVYDRDVPTEMSSEIYKWINETTYYGRLWKAWRKKKIKIIVRPKNRDELVGGYIFDVEWSR